MIVKKIKKIAKRFLNAIPSSAILMFHHVGVSKENQISSCFISKENFELIISKYYSIMVPVDMAIKKNRLIGITFDDGFEDTFNVAYPILKQYGVPFTVFVIEDFIDTPGYITESQLKILINDPLVQIGSHGKTHRILSALDFSSIEDEIAGSRKRLQTRLSVDINMFAYSHGQFNSYCLHIAKQYKYAFAANSFLVNGIAKKNRYCIPRLNMTDSTYSDHFSFFDKWKKGVKND